MLKINSLSIVNALSRPAFKSAEEKNVMTKPQEVENNQLKGQEALAKYNFAMLNYSKKLNVEPVELIIKPDEEINGEKVYDSEGQLEYIQKEDEDTVTKYFFKDNDETKLEETVVEDKATGNVLLRQRNYYDDNGELEDICVTKNSPETGKIIANSWYKDGKFNSATKYEYKENGDEISTLYDYERKNYRVYIDNEQTKTTRYAEFDKNKSLTEASITKEKKLNQTRVTTYLYNGGLYKIEKYDEITIPNILGYEKFNVPELVPYEGPMNSKDAENIEGEKSYYEEGSLMTVKSDEVELEFANDGRLEKAVEKSEGNVSKTTNFYNDYCSVEFVDNKTYKAAEISKEGKPKYYEEGTIDENGKEQRNTSLYYKEKGMLEWASRY